MDVYKPSPVPVVFGIIYLAFCRDGELDEGDPLAISPSPPNIPGRISAKRILFNLGTARLEE
jgi:hypothetical protein